MTLRKLILYFFLFGSMPMALRSQGVHPFDSLVNVVTRQCACVIFYDKKATDTIQYIPSINSLEQFLTHTTQAYGFTYVRDDRGNVYLIKGNTPVVKLPATYFSPARQSIPLEKIEILKV